MQPIETFQSSSSLIAFIDRMQIVDEAAHLLEVGFSIKLEKTDFESWDQLEKFAHEASRGKRKFVVVEHETCYEIARLPDGASRNLYYDQNARPLPPVALQCGQDEMQQAIERVKRIVLEYKAASYEETFKYRAGNEQMKKENVVGKSYIQRRLASTTLFRNNGKLLQSALDSLVAAGFLTEVPTKIASGIYETTAKIYRINEV